MSALLQRALTGVEARRNAPRAGGPEGMDALGGASVAAELSSHNVIFPRSQTSADSPALTPPLVFHSSPSQVLTGYLSHEYTLSYLIATLVVGAMILGAWIHKIPEGPRIAATSPATPIDRPQMPIVGRITGIAGAKWSDDPDYISPIGVGVRLGRQYKLKSGLLEITYDSGAKVILEGPCSYEIESARGGYLALGKLVARVGAGGEGRGAGEVASGQWTVDSMKDEGGRMKAESGRPNAASLATRHQPLATNPSPLSPLPSPLFTVRTPTAVVTDLGTEFGVEVDENGDTTSHVFHGSIQVRLAEVLVVSEADGDDNSTRDVILHENESVRVGSVPEMPSATTVMESVHFTLPTTPPQFVRRLREPPSLLDLLDVVSGGDGLSNRRGRGLDPTSGRRESLFIPRFRDGKRQYQPVGWHPFIDGVFVPGVDRAAVQLDSAGNTFNGFTFTSGKVFGTVWAREAEIDPELRKINDDCWMYAIGPSERFAPEGRGLLGLAPNAGITFNLEMIRRVHQDVVPNGFRAAAGIANARPYFPNAHQMADVWVFVDGRLMLKPTRLRAENTPVPVNVPIGPNDRFLTIVSTDACDGHDFDWVVFGDPALLMTPVFQNPEGMEDSTP